MFMSQNLMSLLKFSALIAKVTGILKNFVIRNIGMTKKRNALIVERLGTQKIIVLGNKWMLIKRR